MCGSDGIVRGAHVKVMSKSGIRKSLRRPLQHIYPLEVCDESQHSQDVRPCDDALEKPIIKTQPTIPKRPVRKAATQARDQIWGCIADD